jgi:hypothetical protein
MMEHQLFEIMRFQILTAAMKAETQDRLTDAYVYAWETRVFPLFNEGAEWHRPFAAHFVVRAEQVAELSKFLDDRWAAKYFPTFYELEEHYGLRSGRSTWHRANLVHACRYLRLSGLFDQAFWDCLVEPNERPAEAAHITAPFDRTRDVYLM